VVLLEALYPYFREPSMGFPVSQSQTVKGSHREKHPSKEGKTRGLGLSVKGNLLSELQRHKRFTGGKTKGFFLQN